MNGNFSQTAIKLYNLKQKDPDFLKTFKEIENHVDEISYSLSQLVSKQRCKK